MIGRTVVDANDFDVGMRLADDAVHTLSQIVFNVVNRDNDRHIRFNKAFDPGNMSERK